jgi:hypothetical protein
LTGMSERVRALDGKLQFAREDERTIVRCSLPMPHDADFRGTYTGAKPSVHRPFKSRGLISPCHRGQLKGGPCRVRELTSIPSQS